MLKRIDEGSEKVTGYSYENLDGRIEYVEYRFGGRFVDIYLDTGDGTGKYDKTTVCHGDIPNLIKALQAAYDHKEA